MPRPTDELGSTNDTSRVLSASFQSGTRGMSPKTVSPGTARSRSSLLLIESSRYSTRNATPTPSIRPKTMPSTALRLGVGAKACARSRCRRHKLCAAGGQCAVHLELVEPLLE